MAYVVRMSKSLNHLGEVVTVALNDAGLSENAASIRSGIPRQTLRRRLVTGDFKYTELCNLADLLDTTPDALVLKARQAAA